MSHPFHPCAFPLKFPLESLTIRTQLVDFLSFKLKFLKFLEELEDHFLMGSVVLIDCELCREKVPFDSYSAHITEKHPGSQPFLPNNQPSGPSVLRNNFVNQMENAIPCDICFKMVRFENFEAHMATEHERQFLNNQPFRESNISVSNNRPIPTRNQDNSSIDFLNSSNFESMNRVIDDFREDLREIQSGVQASVNFGRSLMSGGSEEEFKESSAPHRHHHNHHLHHQRPNRGHVQTINRDLSNSLLRTGPRNHAPQFGRRDIKNLPKTKFRAGMIQCESKNCMICFSDYEEGEEVTYLPCMHFFHSHCIKKWAKTKPTCPVDNMDIVNMMERRV